MSIFPTQYSTLSAGALKNYIEERYGLKLVASRLVLHGVSDTYLLENEATKFILKVYRVTHRSLAEIRGEVELITILYRQGAKVAYAIADRSGEQIQSFSAAEGTRYGVLFSFAPGQSVYDFTDEQLRIVGHEMAVNHTILLTVELPIERKEYTLETMLIQPINTIAPAFDDLPEEYTALTRLADQVIAKMAKFDANAFSYGYCHYDYLPKNFHFDQDNTFTLFDFDFIGKGALANDLASFLIHFFFHITHGKISREEGDRQFRVFLAAYQAVRPLATAERAAIPYLGIMFWVFYLGYQYENFDDWTNTFFTPRYLKERVGVIKRFADMYCQL